MVIQTFNKFSDLGSDKEIFDYAKKHIENGCNY